jgi:hypothetical protein
MGGLGGGVGWCDLNEKCASRLLKKGLAERMQEMVL